jgi:monoamine oxidase
MYVSEYQEDGRNPNAVKQVCRFRDDGWNPTGEGSPVELFFNAGPGRIPRRAFPKFESYYALLSSL